MLSSFSTQFNLLFFSLLAGIITGVLFDLYRVFRGLENPNIVVTFIQDTLFWILTGIIVFIFLLSTNHAYMREYVYITIAAGVLLYMALLSKYFIKVQYKVIRITTKFIRITLNFVLYPLQLLFYTIKRKNKQKFLKKTLEEN